MKKTILITRKGSNSQQSFNLHKKGDPKTALIVLNKL